MEVVSRGRTGCAHHTVGYGHLYQGRFKSFSVQDDGHLLTLCRYAEGHALAHHLVERSKDWRYGSLWVRINCCEKQRLLVVVLVAG